MQTEITSFDIPISNDVVLRMSHSGTDAHEVCDIPKGNQVPLGQLFTGTYVFKASVLLAKYFALETDRIRAKRVLELGAGCGLLGLAVGALGAKEVVVTDEVTHMAERNLRDNAAKQPELRERVKVQELSWGNEEHIAASSPPFDVIVASELLWDFGNVRKLAKTIVELSGPGTHIYIAGPDCLPNQECGIGEAFHRRAFFGILEDADIEMVDLLTADPETKRMKLDFDCGARGTIGIIELKKREIPLHAAE